MKSPKLLYFVLLSCTAFLIQVWHAESNTEVNIKNSTPHSSDCIHRNEYSGLISYNSTIRNTNNLCWYINPPEESLVRVKFLELENFDGYCDDAHILVTDKFERQKFCNGPKWINETNEYIGSVNISLYVKYYKSHVSFLLEYDTESLICDDPEHFRCSSRKCIHPTNVCDGVEDCENGLDERDCGILTIEGAITSRSNAINWLNSRETKFGWGKNTHRAVTSLYLTGAAKFQGESKEEERIVRNLQLKTAASLLRNLTDPMSVNELSMYVNALLVTCHNVRSIFSEDLLDILADRALSSSSPSPGAYLTLCNANWPLSKRNVHELLNLLSKDTEYPFATEIRAMTIMALSCIEKKTSFLHGMYNTSLIYNTVQNFIETQNGDGSFGNVHTTAVVTQALMSSKQMENTKMHVRKAMKFLMKSLNSSADFLSVYFTLPLFKEKTLVDIGSVNCSGYRRKLEEDDDVVDIMEKLGTKIHVQYSLYIGDKKYVAHNIYLKVLEHSTVYDVMKVARAADPKYNFSDYVSKGHVYIYELAGLTNDMEAGNFWLFYIASSNGTDLQQFTQSPDQITMKNKDHLVMWYRSANI